MTVPSSIADNCSSDVTSALNSWIEHLSSGAVVDLPANACYAVSNTSTTLTLNTVHGLTINGNGATLRQSVYEGGQCGNNDVQPVLRLTSDTNITVNDLTIDAPGNCGGADNEGDYGILLGQATPGNTNITFNGVTVANTDGDGLAVLPQLGTCCGINTDVTFVNGAFTNIGYHTITPEGVNGLTIEGNRLADDGNFMDMEVDNNEAPGATCANATGTAQCDVTVEDNSFTGGAGMSINSLQGICIPQGNVTIEDNTLDDTTSGISMLLGGSGSATCSRDSGLTVKGNVSLGPAKSPCGGSITGGPACSIIEIADYSDVTITGNKFSAYDGTPSYFPNTIFTPCITLQGVATATITGNTCGDAYNVESGYYYQFPSTTYASSGVTVCGNTYWLTTPTSGVAADPKRDGKCA